MKKYTYIAFLLLLSGMFSACSKDELSKESVLVDRTEQYHDPFDDWIYKNLTVPYNIRLMYHMEDIESDYQYTLAPADYKNSIRVANIFKYTWLEAYDEICGVDFTRTYVPKVLHLIGSPAYAANGTYLMGTAEGGLKITLYAVNQLQINHIFLDLYYHVIHHEFSHILHQTKDYDPDYGKICEGKYVSGDWYLMSDDYALKNGFISAYAMSEPNEDIAEMTATYITNNAEDWEKIMKQAGDSGAAILSMKLEIIRSYMQNSWNIDLDQLRDVIQRRVDDVISGKIDIDSLE